MFLVCGVAVLLGVFVRIRCGWTYGRRMHRESGRAGRVVAAVKGQVFPAKVTEGSFFWHQ